MERARKIYKLAVAIFAEAADGCACGVLEAEQFSALVEGFAGGIVAGAADAKPAPPWTIGMPSKHCRYTLH